MEQVLELVIEFAQQVPAWLTFTVIIVIAYIENVIPPIPGDLVVVFGGYLAAEGVLSIFPLLIGTTITSTLGFLTLYELGRWWGWNTFDATKHKFLSKWLHSNYVEKAKKLMDRWGMLVIVANRFLAGTRSIISLTAGVTYTPPIKTAIYSGISSLLWNSVLLSGGWYLSKSWRQFGEYLTSYGKIILAFLVVIIAVRWFLKRNVKQNDFGS